LGTIVTGALAAMSTGGRSIANLSATLCYVGVTVLFYYLFRPVNRGLSLVAAIFSLVGCLAGALTALELTLLPVSPLVFFGVYCLLIGYLILQSTFLPRILGVLMAIGGADLRIAGPLDPALPLQHAPGRRRGRSAHPVAPRQRRRCSEVENAGDGLGARLIARRPRT